MSRGIFVTGTDTGVGKTMVAAGIIRWLRGQGMDTVPVKPVQTGAQERGGELFAPDLAFCLSASGMQPPATEIQLMSPYLYRPACSPHLAARLSGRYPEISVIQGCVGTLLLSHQAVVVEGAGGIMAPLNEENTMLDLMKALGYPVVLVSRTGLGAINHALLSLQALRAAGLTPVGVVFNQTEPPVAEDRFIHEDNPRTIARLGRVPVLGQVDYLDMQAPAADTWRHFDESVPGLPLVGQKLEHSQWKI